MKTAQCSFTVLFGVFLALLCAAGQARAALVPPSGYTNSFSSLPSTNDWATTLRSGLSNDAYDMDSDVNSNMPSSVITNVCISNTGNPPTILGGAAWSSTGLYLQTRPSSSRYIVLMGKFVNDTGTNATQIAISYRLTFAGAAFAEDAGKGTRAYYSFTGATGSWVNLPSFNTTANSGTSILSTNLPIFWPYGSNLFLLWVDDNAVPTSDTANQIDDFSLAVTAGAAPTVEGILTAPTNGAVYFSDAAITSSVNVFNGTPPYVVNFRTNSSGGNVFQNAGTVTTAPYNLNFGVLPPGNYKVYATVADENGAGSTTNTVTNAFTVVDAIVRLTGPTNGQLAPIGSPVQLSATAAVGASLSVTNVEFFVNGVSAGSDTNAPYSISYPSQPAGTYTVYAAVKDSLGRTHYTLTNQFVFAIDPLGNNLFANRYLLGTPASVTGNNTGANTEGGEPTFQFGGGLPFIQWGATLWWKWTAPFNGTVTIDTFGSSINTVLSVYTGTALNQLTLVSRNDNAPGQANVSLVSFTAQAGTEYQIQLGGNGGGFGGGQPAQGPWQLNLSMPPFVAITNPVAGTAFLVGSNFTVDAIAASGAGSVTNVSIYRGSTLLGSANVAPYSFVVSNSPVGSNLLYAVATDSIGQVGTSAVVRVLVADVGITLTSPQDGTIFNTTNPINLSAYTALPSGSVTNVNFFVDGVSVGQDFAAPYSVTWSNVTGGSHRISANGSDDSGNFYEAVPVYIGVGQVMIHSNAVWKYFDKGQDLSNAWFAVGYDDSAWSSGPAELGYGDGGEATVVEDNTTPGYGPNDNDRYITTYFRRTFNAVNVPSLTNMVMSLMYDDGAAVYLNGREVYRTANLATNAAYNTGATGQGLEETLDVAAISLTNLLEGENVIAVEIHQQNSTSSDISFFLQLVAAPIIDRNQYPVVALTSPTNNATFIAPSSIALSATASDADGTVTNVEFYADNVKLGEDAGSPYTGAWPNPPVGLHSLYAAATDNQGGRNRSATVNIAVHDAAGNPIVRIMSPGNNAVMEGPTNLVVTATAVALDSVTGVQFLANGAPFGDDASNPYSAVWNAPFGTNLLQAIVTGANGKRGTSDVVTVVITIPPTNTVPPTVAAQFPAAFSVVTNATFTNITVRFSERVQNVDASDFLINGVAATSVSGSGSNYVFTFPRPPYGEVEFIFITGHGITDFGYPGSLPYDELDGSGYWKIEYQDVVPPVVAAHIPATGATVTNLPTVSVTFSEAVTGVDAADLLVNGTPGYAVSGSGSNYIFSVGQPASGTVNITWATNHGITDLGVTGPPLAFNRTGAGNTWNFTLDSRTTLIASNSNWRFLKGLAEASEPSNAWRQLSFNDSGWSNSPAPFVFGEPGFTNALIPGTDVSDMNSNAYSSIYLRQTFVLAKASALTNLLLSHQSDDGFIAWINGVEAFRFNMPTGFVAFNGSAAAAGAESGGNNGAAYAVVNLNNALGSLVTGTNILAIHAFNHVTNPPSSDFVFNATLYSHIPDFGVVPPRIASVVPAQGELFSLTNLTVTFTEPVTNVNASDLLVNGVPASSMVSTSSTEFTFNFSQPAYGTVAVTWAVSHGIVDFDDPGKPFDATLASARFNYSLINPSAPLVFAQTPVGGTIITGLTSIAVTFSERVSGVSADDLLINGVPATSVSGSGSNYTFNVAQPGYGSIAVRWSTNNGIQDLEVPANPFDRTRPNNQWNYSLVNPVPTVVLTSPTNNAYMLPPANVPLRVNATDNDGTIVLVEYYDMVEGAVIASSTNAPFSSTWSNLALGTYTLRAVVTDNSGIVATSAPITFSVVTEIPPLLTRGPYLQVGSPTGAVIRWRTDVAAGSLVRYGTTLGSLTNSATGTNNITEHIVKITGLQPDTKYYYSIGSATHVVASGADYWFYTHPIAGTPKPTRIWALGDAGTANANQEAVRDAFYNFANNTRPADLWLMLGDNAYNVGSDSEHQAAVFDMYPETLRNHFLWPVLGNHESSQSYTATTFPYLDIFTLPTQGEAGGVPSGNPKYYSFDYANIHFVGLDSMTSTRSGTSPMAQWLRNDLESTTQPWIIVYFHHPPYTKGSHNSDSETDLIEVRQNILPILERYGVDLVLSGHSHCMERSFLLHGHYGISTTLDPAMMINSGDGREDGTGIYSKNAFGQGTVYIVGGSSGQATGGTLNHPAHFRSLNELGSLVIDVNGDRLDSMFLTSTGLTNDHFTLVKSPQATTFLINSIQQAGTNVVLSFDANANTTYTLEHAPAATGPWQAIQTISAATTNRLLRVPRPAAETNRYYRLRSP